jgi:hypothetical protein
MSFIVNPYWYAQACPDADANAFLTATGITDPTISGAVCTLVTSLKSANLWTKLNAIYPFVGGTATTHKFNLKNPADTNAAFRLSFVGGWTHSANGATPNGTNAYADTFLNPFTNLSLNSHSFGIYSRTNNTTGAQVYGSFQNSNTSFLQNNLTAANFVSGSTSNILSYTANPSTSFLMGTRTSNTIFRAFRAGVLLGTNTNVISALPNGKYFLGARFNSVTLAAELFTVHQLAFAFVGGGLSNSEALTFYNIVQAFQTTLARQI